MSKYGLKEIATITFFDKETDEILAWNEEKQEFVGTGEYREPETELAYSTEEEDCDDDYYYDDRLDCGCCRCCGCSCYDDEHYDEYDDDYDNEEDDTE